MDFQKTQHLGLDDARNLMVISKKMHEEECVFITNSWYDPSAIIRT